MAIQELDQLKALGFTKQLTFAYLTCERLYPNYIYFSNNFDFGNPAILRGAIDFMNQTLFERTSNLNKVDSLIKEVNKNTPDTEDFTTTFVSSALDVCSAIFESLNFLIDKNFSRIIAISTAAIDTVDMYIQEIESLDFNKDRDFRKKIDEHPLMKREISIQSIIISFLSTSDTLHVGDMENLLRFQDNNKKGSLNL